MNTHSSHSLSLSQSNAVVPIGQCVGPADISLEESRATRAETLQRRGNRMILAGFVITIAGVIAYCLACFAAGNGADMGAVLVEDAVPFARSTLVVLALGTLVWLVGSFTYLRGAMDADEETKAN